MIWRGSHDRPVYACPPLAPGRMRWYRLAGALATPPRKKNLDLHMQGKGRWWQLTTTNDLQPRRPLLRARDVARLWRVDEATVWRWVRLGYITPIRVERTTRFDPDEIERLIRGH